MRGSMQEQEIDRVKKKSWLGRKHKKSLQKKVLLKNTLKIKGQKKRQQISHTEKVKK